MIRPAASQTAARLAGGRRLCPGRSAARWLAWAGALTGRAGLWTPCAGWRCGVLCRCFRSPALHCCCRFQRQVLLQPSTLAAGWAVCRRSGAGLGHQLLGPAARGSPASLWAMVLPRCWLPPAGAEAAHRPGSIAAVHAASVVCLGGAGGASLWRWVSRRLAAHALLGMVCSPAR